MRRALPLAVALLAVVVALPASAVATGHVRAVFFKEWDRDDLTYTVAQGELVTFRNDDPFLTHALSSQPPGLFGAEEIPVKQSRLITGVPYLTTGSYPFEDPLHPEMAATLIVTGAGAPLPPDLTAPSATLKIKSSRAGRMLKEGRVHLKVTTAEPMDVGLVVRAGNTVLTKAHRTYVIPGSKTASLRIAHTRFVRALDAKRAKRKRTIKLRVFAFLGDAAGNAGQASAARALRVPRASPGL